MTDQRASEHRGGPAGDTVDSDADAGHDHGIEGESAAGGGHDHGAGTGAAVDADDRCDLGFNTPAFNDVSVPGVPHAHDDGAGGRCGPAPVTLGQ